ncbi:sensor histidine kinase [Kitasatospora sp. CB02891]|uniref:sensor histidine kinase n=1 Tax=Kitasatospora sp. CB02891 TaxID=2020329 RepID=UPI000C2794B2|nr:histidine kinase [Kitasatospora sp. CB02891]PJN28012.1 two-component sensor histidine kinase [Kitasatospora sp. CB02891]
MSGEPAWDAAGLIVPAAVAGWALYRPRQGWPAAGLSLALSCAAGWAGPYRGGAPVVGLAGVVELAALVGLVVLAVRRGRYRSALWTALAVLGWPMRFVGFDPLLPVFGALALAAAGTAGRYLHALDRQRERAVAAARHAQRLELAHDLHDFVAHDVSGMVAQAQAGALLVQQSPERAAALFARIEQAGQHALAALDRTVDLLRAPDQQDGGGRAALGGLDELPDLAARFTATGGPRVQLALTPGPVGRECAATVHRIAVEALTNVRRHAPTARTVRIELARTADRLELVVHNDGPAAARRSRPRGGHGLAGLAARVEALGGTFRAGPVPDGWQLTAIFPTPTPLPETP